MKIPVMPNIQMEARVHRDIPCRLVAEWLRFVPETCWRWRMESWECFGNWIDWEDLLAAGFVIGGEGTNALVLTVVIARVRSLVAPRAFKLGRATEKNVMRWKTREEKKRGHTHRLTERANSCTFFKMIYFVCSLDIYCMNAKINK